MRNRFAKRGTPKMKRIIRRTTYSFLTHNWRLTLCLAVIAGLICSMLYVGVNYYNSYTTSWASVSIVYPKIANGTYPDGSRFTLYSLANEENVSAVLDQMHAEGKYRDFDTEDMMRGIRVTAVTDSGIEETVTNMQSEGNNYSYFASEYELEFVQPRVESAPLYKQLQEDNFSAEFLQRLIALDASQLEYAYGGLDSFKAVMNAELPEQLDYSEWVVFYGSQTRAVRNYLVYLSASAGNFRSASTGKNLEDLKDLFATMSTQRLDEISNYIQNSGLAIDRESLINKITVQIENETLNYKKQMDSVEANGYAKDEYDHTFTENLIVVATSDEYGLYQARPKTVFDTVVNQYNDALIASIELNASIQDKKKDLLLYEQAEESADDYQRMNAKCVELIETYESDYDALCKMAYATVKEYLETQNNSYMNYEIKERKVLDPSLMVKAVIVFILGCMVIVMTSLITAPVLNSMYVNRRRRKMKSIHDKHSKDHKEGRGRQ